MDNTNNKNVFSLKLFWQTVIQLKVIGFISLAVDGNLYQDFQLS